MTSGVRMGTPGITSMGMKEADMQKVGEWIVRILDALPNSADAEASARKEIAEFCTQFQIPGLDD